MNGAVLQSQFLPETFRETIDNHPKIPHSPSNNLKSVLIMDIQREEVKLTFKET
jgi:hypothetical protein